MGKTDFIDEVKLFVRAGHGGAGSCHFRRERYVPKGGPDGGDGGDGGSVILQGTNALRTLIDFRYQKHLLAEHGAPGSGNQRTGAQGKDLVVPVPLGTVIKQEDGTIVGEVTQQGQCITVAVGGKGGRGNTHFATATNRAPRYAQQGTHGREHVLHLELKLLGDVGLVGLPNAGKSTLLSVLSAAQPAIGDYPFTTIRPNIGMVFYQAGKSFAMADIPGLIAGASKGKGLGLRFLRHIERCQTLLFVIAADANVRQTYDILCQELACYDRGLLAKTARIVITKVDLVSQERLEKIQEALPKSVAPVFVSAYEEKGLKGLKRIVWESIQQQSAIA